MEDSKLMGTWKLTKNGKELMAAPRGAMVRSIMLNHWYHHRGQLSVYLRELDVLVPSIYGPSADENPFQLRNSGKVKWTIAIWPFDGKKF